MDTDQEKLTADFAEELESREANSTLAMADWEILRKKWN